jgi:hypothetical protein
MLDEGQPFSLLLFLYVRQDSQGDISDDILGGGKKNRRVLGPQSKAGLFSNRHQRLWLLCIPELMAAFFLSPSSLCWGTCLGGSADLRPPVRRLGNRFPMHMSCRE